MFVLRKAIHNLTNFMIFMALKAYQFDQNFINIKNYHRNHQVSKSIEKIYQWNWYGQIDIERHETISNKSEISKNCF